MEISSFKPLLNPPAVCSRSHERVLVAELNMGQLAHLLRAAYLVPAESLTKIQGQPFKIAEIRRCIEALLARGEA